MFVCRTANRINCGVSDTRVARVAFIPVRDFVRMITHIDVPLMDVTHARTHARKEMYWSPVYDDSGPFLLLSKRCRATSCTGSMHVQKVHPRRGELRPRKVTVLISFFSMEHDARCKMRRVGLAVVIIANKESDIITRYLTEYSIFRSIHCDGINKTLYWNICFVSSDNKRR